MSTFRLFKILNILFTIFYMAILQTKLAVRYVGYSAHWKHGVSYHAVGDGKVNFSVNCSNPYVFQYSNNLPYLELFS